LALPGGIGTFEELFEAWTWRQLGYHDKPIGILNCDGYYDGLVSFIGQVVQHDFMGSWQNELVSVQGNAIELLTSLVEQSGLSLPSRTELI
jgi:uncharacterized protein (TIGR00730 family)